MNSVLDELRVNLFAVSHVTELELMLLFQCHVVCGNSLYQGLFNPLSPKIHKQILQTDLHTFLLRTVEGIWLRLKRSPFGNQFSNSHNLYS